MRRTALRALAELPLLLLAALVVAFVIKTFAAQAFSIPSASMEPQLHVGDRVVVSKLAYRFHDPNRGDVVVFDSPTAPRRDGGSFPGNVLRDVLEGVGLRRPGDEELIKRIIALPGETVEARDGRVFIDGRELVEPYLPPGITTSDFAPRIVPDGMLWMMGDNRGNSMDSRTFGFVKESAIVGRAVARVWPPGRTAFL